MQLDHVTAPADHAAADLRRTKEDLRRQLERVPGIAWCMSLARLRRQHGKQQEPAALLAPILGWFTEGFDTADLQAAHTLLDDLENPAALDAAG